MEGKVYKSVCSSDEWREFIEKMHSGEQFEVDQENFYYWLEVLPPVFMSKVVTLPGGREITASFGFAEGHEPITVFWEEHGRYYGQRTTELNRWG